MSTPCNGPPAAPEKSRRSGQFLEVEAAHAGRRIDNYLLSRTGLPRSALYRLLRRGSIRLNGGRAGPDRRIHAGDRIRIPPLRPVAPGRPGDAEHPGPLAAVALYEDEHLLVLDKPAGVAVHGGTGLGTDLRRQARYSRQRPLELVHRLDRDTSGCLLLCSDPGMLAALHGLFRRSEPAKTYLALVRGQPPARMDIRFPLSRLPGGNVAAAAAGRRAHTHLRVIRRYECAALVRLRPFTGRTHQLRAHAAEAGYPIAGDHRYGDRGFNRALRRAGLQRLFLHARGLALALPAGRRLHVKAPLPAPLRRVLEALDRSAL